jgi:hypothetical protein
MKIAICGAWGGGFMLTKEVARILGVDIFDDSDAVRTNPLLIKMLEEGEEIEDLEVVEIPDNVTDYKITEYDGIERVIYVVDGKLHYA